MVDHLTIKDETLDRRRKLMAEDRENIHDLHKKGLSLRAIARIFGVSHRPIGFAINPETTKHITLTGQQKKYYDKKKWKIYMRGHRAYKRKLLDQGLIGD